MKKTVIVASLCIAAFFLYKNASDYQKPALFDTEAVDALMFEMQNAYEIPGLALAIVKEGKVIYTKGYGIANLDTGKKTDSATLFPIGSCTKAFTSLSLLLLANQGLLHLDEPIVKYLPEFRLSDPNTTATTTITDLLCHRTALGRHERCYFYSDFPRHEFLNRLPYLESLSHFPKQYLYNNIMYAVAGILVDKVSGISWESYLKKTIFDPLGMTSTTTTYDHQSHANIAAPHLKIRGKMQVVPYGDTTPVAPAAGILSSANDLSKWMLFQLSHEPQLITKEALDLTHRLHMEIKLKEDLLLNPLGYGLGWVIAEHDHAINLHHQGYIRGFHSIISLYPEDQMGITLLANTRTKRAMMHAVHALRSLLKGEPLPQPAFKVNPESEPSTPIHKSSSNPDLKAYVGHYFHPGYGNLEVVWKNDQLTILYLQNSYSVYFSSFDKAEIFCELPEALLFQSEFKSDALLIHFDPALQPIRFEKKQD